MKQVLLKAVFLMTIVAFMSSGAGINDTNACDKKLCTKICLHLKKQCVKAHIEKTPATADYPDLILTNTILRF
jgi:hypothetical protein